MWTLVEFKTKNIRVGCDRLSLEKRYLVNLIQ